MSYFAELKLIVFFPHPGKGNNDKKTQRRSPWENEKAERNIWPLKPTNKKRPARNGQSNWTSSWQDPITDMTKLNGYGKKTWERKSEHEQRHGIFVSLRKHVFLVGPCSKLANQRPYTHLGGCASTWWNVSTRISHVFLGSKGNDAWIGRAPDIMITPRHDTFQRCRMAVEKLRG